MSIQPVPSTQILFKASAEFKYGNSQEGMRCFDAVCKEPHDDENGVYKALWVLKGKPEGDPDFGRNCFHDVNGLHSMALEKAEAIDQYLVSKGILVYLPKDIGDRIRNQANGYETREIRYYCGNGYEYRDRYQVYVPSVWESAKSEKAAMELDKQLKKLLWDKLTPEQRDKANRSSAVALGVSAVIAAPILIADLIIKFRGI